MARTNSSGGGLPYEKEGDTRRKIRIELLKMWLYSNPEGYYTNTV